MNLEIIQEYIRPELLVLTPAALCLGYFIKTSTFIDSKYIPLTLGVFGIFLALMYEVYCEGLNLYSVFTAITQGLLAVGFAVYLHQVKKQGESNE